MTLTRNAWVPVEGFPGYLINPNGDVINDNTGRHLKRSPVQTGAMTVGMFKDGVQCRRSVSRLVAETFLDPPIRDDFDTVVHLDGDRSNCHYENLVWRPRWFAIKYQQNRDSEIYDHIDVKLLLVDTGEIFNGIAEPAMKYGLLDNDIFASYMNETVIFPYGYRFAQVE